MSCEFYVLDSEGNRVCASELADPIIMESDAKILWLILSGALVFYMHLGFSTLEAGCVSQRNVQNILLKNIMNACIGTIVFYCVGYAAAYGGEGFVDAKFIGTTGYFQDPTDNISFFFQWAFCVTASTIVSGAVAERMKLGVFFCACVFITGWIYPITVHWVWDGEHGWLSGFNEKAPCPIIDFAGSGVVHMVGGWCALVGAYMAGPRLGVFDDKNPTKYGNHSVPFQLFGTMTLWFGWYGFNCGSTLAVSGYMKVASNVAVTTTLSAASGGIVTCLWAKFIAGKWNIGSCCNGVLAGLVSITASCAVVRPWAAIIVGVIGGSIYFGASNLMLCFKIDDPLDAVSVHACCGFWGVIAAGIMASNKLVEAAYSPWMAEIKSGDRFLNQLAGAVTITVWTISCAVFIFKVLDWVFGGLRTDKGQAGLDEEEFGMPAYSQTPSKTEIRLVQYSDL